MRPIGNSLIIIAQLFWLSILVFFPLAFLMTVLFTCDGGFTTDASCVRGGLQVQDAYSFIVGWLGLSAYAVIPISLPIVGVGLLLRSSTKSSAAISKSTTDTVVTSFGKLLLVAFKVLLMGIFWWATIIVFLYQSIKLKSFGQALAVLKNFVRGT